MKKNKMLLIGLLIITLVVSVGYGYKRNKHFNDVLQNILEVNNEVEEVNGGSGNRTIINGIKSNNVIYIYHSLDKDETVDTIFWNGYREISRMYSEMYFDNTFNDKRIPIFHIYGDENVEEIYYVSMNGYEIYDYYDGWKENKNKIVKKIIENIKENNMCIALTNF